MTKKMLVAGDIGYSAVKAMKQGGDKLYFPSGAAPAAFANESLSGDSEQPLMVRGTPYFAGFEDGDANYQRHTAGRFAMSDDYMALYLHMLCQLGEAKIDTMVLGLPSREFSTEVKAFLKEHMAGTFKDVRGVDYTVKSVLVADQPLGTAAWHYKNAKDDLSDQRIAICDIGNGTVDFALVVNGKKVPAGSTSIDAAMRVVCQAIAEEASAANDYSLTGPWVDRHLRAGVLTPKKWNKPVDLKKYSVAICTEVAAVIVNALKGTVGNLQEIDRVVIAGGGSILLGEHIEKLVKGTPITIVDDPVWSNLLGFIAMAETRV